MNKQINSEPTVFADLHNISNIRTMIGLRDSHCADNVHNPLHGDGNLPRNKLNSLGSIKYKM